MRLAVCGQGDLVVVPPRKGGVMVKGKECGNCWYLRNPTQLLCGESQSTGPELGDFLILHMGSSEWL